jgi:hypothetical protein
VGPEVLAHVPAGFDGLEPLQLHSLKNEHFDFFRNIYAHDGQSCCAEENPWDNYRCVGRFLQPRPGTRRQGQQAGAPLV